MNSLGQNLSENYKQSKIIIGTKFTSFQDYIPQEKIKRTIIITDKNINTIYGEHFVKFPIIEIKAGEDSKTMKTAMKIVEQLLELEADRHSYLLAIGGGVICDITGFVASVFMRGIPFSYISTSLLSQVDASIGGKTGVNFKGFKNIIGTFNHPEFVICDQQMLSSLPKSEFTNGMGEVIKHACISSQSMFNFLKTNSKQILEYDITTIKQLIEKSIEIKTDIVTKDEFESGERKKLNFGHTIGHAIEMNSKLNHGEAISVGMVMAAKLSYQKGYCSRSVIKEIESLCKAFGLPVKTRILAYKLIDVIKKDKKKKDKYIDFVFIEEIGRVRIEKLLTEDIIKVFAR